MNKKILTSIFLIIFVLGSNSLFIQKAFSSEIISKENNLVRYDGKIEHIFFHSLIIYPEKANSDIKNATGYRDNMITAEQFKKIIEQLYQNNFILINSESLYSFDENGKIIKNILYLPKNKKPLIISLDDLSYYSYMKNGGFANKLVLDAGIVKTEVITPSGKKIITEDGDVVPILDKFVKDHPDFSFNNAKGIIALTGFEGILGYRTQLNNKNNITERASVVPVIDALKKSGWVFASHSYTHNQIFLKNTISVKELNNDIYKWKSQVEPLVGKTNIFIGPFGQVFNENDIRRKILVDAGFSILYGIGMDGYEKFFNNHFVMNRIDIDGYRLTHSSKKLYKLFGISVK